MPVYPMQVIRTSSPLLPNDVCMRREEKRHQGGHGEGGGSEGQSSTTSSSTSSSTSTTSPSTPTPTLPPPTPATVTSMTPNQLLFSFKDPMNTTSCGTLELSWNYSGQDEVAVTLIVQDEVFPMVSMSASTSTNKLPTPSVSFRTLTTDAPSNADSYIWTSVDLNEGWYTAKAFDTAATLGISALSNHFFVSQGTNTSCLLSNLTNTTATANPALTSTTAVNFTPHRKGIRVGDIVGISLGVTAGIILMLAAFVLFPRLWRRELPNPKRRRPYLLY